MLLCIGTCNTKRDPLLNNIMDVRLVGKKETGHLAKDARSPNLDLANLETFIFDFSGDLYGATLSVALVDFMRPEIKFDSLEKLIVQMDQDSLKAKELLKSLK